MLCDKGKGHVTLEDISALMDLYAQAIETFNLDQDQDRQQYYQQKLVTLVQSPLLLHL